MVAAIIVGCKTWHPPSLRQPLPSWWDSVWAFTRLNFLMNFLWSYGRNCSKAQQKSGCLNEAKPSFETESVSVRVGKSRGNLTNPLSVHIFFFDKTIQCQILSFRHLVVLCTPPCFLMPPRPRDRTNHCFLWQLSGVFPAFSPTLAVSLAPSWHRMNKNTTMKHYQSRHFSWLASFLFCLLLKIGCFQNPQLVNCTSINNIM